MLRILTVLSAGRCDEGGPEFFRIGFPHTNRSEDPCFVTTAWVLWVQAVLSQLADIDNGACTIGQLHERFIVARGGKIGWTICSTSITKSGFRAYGIGETSTRDEATAALRLAICMAPAHAAGRGGGPDPHQRQARRLGRVIQVRTWRGLQPARCTEPET